MSWADNLQSAAFRGVAFDVRATDDDVARDLAAHVYPYRDGAAFEDLGRGPRQFNLSAVLWGADYESRLRTLIQALDVADVGDLVHPVLGILWVRAAGYRVHHDADGRDACTVSLLFVEHVAAPGFFDHALAAQKAAAIAQRAAIARAASAEALGRKVETLRDLLRNSELERLRREMNATAARLLAQAKGVIGAGLDVLAVPRAWATDIVSVADSFLSLYDWTEGQVQQDYMALTRLADLFGFDSADGDGVASPGRPAIDAHLAATRATLLADGAVNVLAVEAGAPTLSPPEIEAVANTARAALDAAIEAARAAVEPADLAAVVEPLRDTALAVQEAARAVIEARPPMIERAVEAPACLRLLAHRWYGDHARALELQRLNNLSMPNFLERGDVLHAYAA